MRFQNLFVSKDGRFSLGIDLQTGGKYISIPVSNNVVDYEEYYLLTEELFEDFMKDREKAQEFAKRCGSKEFDDLLIFKPGTDRGVY